MKNSMRRAMISTVCMLIVAVMSLTGVTYAWFTQGADATINQIDVTVQSAEGGIQMSKNGTDWMSQFTASKVQEYKAVSTAGELDDNKELKFFSAEVNPAKNSEIKTTAATPAYGYLREELYIRNVSGQQMTVQWKDLTVAAEALAASKNAHYASRIALVIEQKYTAFTNEETNTPDTSFTPQVMIYEPEAAKHTDNAKHLTGIGDVVHDSFKGIFQASEGFVASDSTSIAKAMPAGVVKTNAGDVRVTLDNQAYYKISIYVWIEGQDIDCENSVAAGKFSFNLVFSKVENAGT